MVVVRQRRRLRRRDRRRIGFCAIRPERLSLEHAARLDDLILRRDQLDLARAALRGLPARRRSEAARDSASATIPAAQIVREEQRGDRIAGTVDVSGSFGVRTRKQPVSSDASMSMHRPASRRGAAR